MQETKNDNMSPGLTNRCPIELYGSTLRLEAAIRKSTTRKNIGCMKEPKPVGASTMVRHTRKPLEFVSLTSGLEIMFLQSRSNESKDGIVTAYGGDPG